MSNNVRLRVATTDDVSDMADIMMDAFRDTILSKKSFPESDPATRQHHVSWIENNLKDPSSHLIVAQDASSSSSSPARIAAWARWVRREPAHPPGPRLVFTPDLYPASGDGAFAARFYQANYDATRRIVGDRVHWFLSIIVVSSDLQRRGFGSALMRFGVEKADEECLPAYVNGSPEGKALYEAYGFRTVESSTLEGHFVGYHMLRDAVSKGVHETSS